VREQYKTVKEEERRKEKTKYLSKDSTDRSDSPSPPPSLLRKTKHPKAKQNRTPVIPQPAMQKLEQKRKTAKNYKRKQQKKTKDERIAFTAQQPGSINRRTEYTCIYI
jgi:hypothetical protein